MFGASRSRDDAGFFTHAAGIVSAALSYLKVRLQLVGLEGKAAALHYAIILGLVIGALVVVVFGYIFLCFAIILSP